MRRDFKGPWARWMAATLLVGCSGGGDDASSSDVCAEAADVVAGCLDAPAERAAGECDSTLAQRIVDEGCDGVSALEDTGKTDGSWSDFMCGLGFTSYCATLPQNVESSIVWAWDDSKGETRRLYEASSESGYRITAIVRDSNGDIKNQYIDKGTLHYQIGDKDWAAADVTPVEGVGLEASIYVDERTDTQEVKFYFSLTTVDGETLQHPKTGQAGPSVFNSIGMRPQLLINEYKSNGTDDDTDPDWLEIYNKETYAVNMYGLILNACGGASNRCGTGSRKDNRIAGYHTTIPAGGYLVFRFDDRKPSGQRIRLHINEGIGSDEAIALHMPDDQTVIDSFRPSEENPAWEDRHPNGTYSRTTDGAGEWKDGEITLCAANGSGATADLEELKRLCPYYAYVTHDDPTNLNVYIPKEGYEYGEGWRQKEIEAKFDSDQYTFDRLKSKLDGSKVQGYDLRDRWNGKDALFIDIYYDTVVDSATYREGVIRDAGHALRYRTRFLADDDNKWIPSWSKLQYKSDTLRFGPIWFRTETSSDMISADLERADAVLHRTSDDTRCQLYALDDAPETMVEPPDLAALEQALKDNDTSILPGADTALFQSLQATFDALRVDHFGVDAGSLVPRLMLVDYRYRVEFKDNDGKAVHEASFDHITHQYTLPYSELDNRYACNAERAEVNDSYAIELETLWEDGLDKEVQLRELFKLCGLLGVVPGVVESVGSKGGSTRTAEVTFEVDEIEEVKIRKNEFLELVVR